MAKKSSPKQTTEIQALPKLRIRILAFDHKVADLSCKQIVEAAIKEWCKVAGPVPLPTEIKKYTVLRSPFVHKDSREQSEIRYHKRLIDILNPNQKIIEALQNLTLPSGVDIEIKTIV